MRPLQVTVCYLRGAGVFRLSVQNVLQMATMRQQLTVEQQSRVRELLEEAAEIYGLGAYPSTLEVLFERRKRPDQRAEVADVYLKERAGAPRSRRPEPASV